MHHRRRTKIKVEVIDNAELGVRLCETLLSHMGERHGGQPEDPETCLYRIIQERDQALASLALRVIKQERGE